MIEHLHLEMLGNRHHADKDFFWGGNLGWIYMTQFVLNSMCCSLNYLLLNLLLFHHLNVNLPLYSISGIGELLGDVLIFFQSLAILSFSSCLLQTCNGLIGSEASQKIESRLRLQHHFLLHLFLRNEYKSLKSF